MIIYGDGTDIEFLKSENIQDVDSLIAVTENEKTNLIAGLLANHLGAKQNIMHVVTTQYIRTIQEIGVGAVISKNLSTVNAILRELHSDVSEIHTITFDEIDVDVMEFQPDVDCLVTKKPIKELDFPKDSIVGMINHHGKIQIPHGNSKLSADDTVLVFTKPHSINKLKKMFDA
jgi:trk system potassium uptake protein TrkA